MTKNYSKFQASWAIWENKLKEYLKFPSEYGRMVKQRNIYKSGECMLQSHKIDKNKIDKGNELQTHSIIQ